MINVSELTKKLRFSPALFSFSFGFILVLVPILF